MRAWGGAISAGHVVLGALGWLLLGVPPVFFAGCAVVTFAGALVAAPLMRPRPDDDDGDGGGGGGDGGPDEPPWWPDFERDFRRHVERQPRQRA